MTRTGARRAVQTAAFALVIGGVGATQAWAAPTCPHQTPKAGEWRVVRGYGQGATKGQAIEAAQRNAQLQLRTQLKGAHDDQTLNQLVSGLNFTIYPSEYDAESQEACVLGIVENINLGATQKAHSAQLDEGITALAERIKEKLKKNDRLFLDVPEWAGLWPGAEPARELRNHLQGRLEGVTLAQQRPTHMLRGEVTGAGGQCRWVPLLEQGAGKVQFPLGEVLFHPLALGLQRCEGAQVVGNHPLPKAKQGETGLALTLTTTLSTTTPCGGEPFQIELQSNQAAHVRLYSIASDGRAMMLMPQLSVKPGEPVAITDPLNPARHVHLQEGVVSGLFAVGLPERETFPDLAVHEVGCMGKGGLNLSKLPPTAAIDGAALTVKAPNAPGCSQESERISWHSALLQTLEALPTCGQ